MSTARRLTNSAGVICWRHLTPCALLQLLYVMVLPWVLVLLFVGFKVRFTARQKQLTTTVVACGAGCRRSRRTALHGNHREGQQPRL